MSSYAPSSFIYGKILLCWKSIALPLILHQALAIRVSMSIPLLWQHFWKNKVGNFHEKIWFIYITAVRFTSLYGLENNG